MMMTTAVSCDDYPATSGGHAARMNNTEVGEVCGRGPSEEKTTRMFSGATSSSNTYIPSNTWEGSCPRYYFGTCDRKTGYHRDTAQSDAVGSVMSIVAKQRTPKIGCPDESSSPEVLCLNPPTQKKKSKKHRKRLTPPGPAGDWLENK
eukprot:scaffold20606_cov58-Attheya_sp.AAC.6